MKWRSIFSPNILDLQDLLNREDMRGWSCAGTIYQKG